MDVDIVKTSVIGDNSSMDMIPMMMQMEKFPEFYEHYFYNNNNTPTTYYHPQEQHELFIPSETTSTIFNINPNNNNNNNNNNVAPPPPTPPSPSSLLDPLPLSNVNTIMHQPKPSSTSPSTKLKNVYHHSSLSAEKRNTSSSSMASMREMIFRIAVMQPVHIDPESVKPPKRRNVKISKDPQSVAARQRRERISERIRILQRLVPGGTKMDTASMLDEAIHYVKFLKKQVQTLEQAGVGGSRTLVGGVGYPTTIGMLSNGNVNNNNNNNYSPLLMKGCQSCPMVGSTSKQLLS